MPDALSLSLSCSSSHAWGMGEGKWPECFVASGILLNADKLKDRYPLGHDDLPHWSQCFEANESLNEEVSWEISNGSMFH